MAGLNRGEWAATKAIQLPVMSDLYKRPEVRALIAGTTAPVAAETTAGPDLEARVKALEADVAALKARG